MMPVATGAASGAGVGIACRTACMPSHPGSARRRASCVRASGRVRVHTCAVWCPSLESCCDVCVCACSLMLPACDRRLLSARVVDSVPSVCVAWLSVCFWACGLAEADCLYLARSSVATSTVSAFFLADFVSTEPSQSNQVQTPCHLSYFVDTRATC